MFGRSKNRMAETQDVASLLEASLQGSTQAFEAIVGRYQSLVCAITYSGTGSVDRSEELAQETFLRAWKSLDQLQDLAKFRPWLCSIARSTVQNWFRSRRQDVVGKAAPLDSAVEKTSEEAGPVEAAMRKERQAASSAIPHRALRSGGRTRRSSARFCRPRTGRMPLRVCLRVGTASATTSACSITCRQLPSSSLPKGRARRSISTCQPNRSVRLPS
jgi:RNA polymerase sigma factor (sigma-70 family)